MSAIADFSELVLAVGEHINRTDLVDVIPRFVRMAELKLDRELRLRDQEASDDLTTDADGEVALPSDFLEVRSIYVTGSPPIIIPALSEDNSIREYTAGPAVGFIINGDTLRIRPAAVATVRLNYFSSIPALETSTDQVNWLLTKYPDIYLYSTIFEAAVYTGDTDRASAADALAKAAIASAMRYSKMSKLSRARVRVGGFCP